MHVFVCMDGYMWVDFCLFLFFQYRNLKIIILWADFPTEANAFFRSIYHYFYNAQLHSLKNKIIGRKLNGEVFITLLIWKVMSRHGCMNVERK